VNFSRVVSVSERTLTICRITREKIVSQQPVFRAQLQLTKPIKMIQSTFVANIKKTNAMRMLDSAGIDYEVQEYEFDENDLDGHHVAEFLNIPYEEVFKTIVAKADDGYVVFCLSVDDELDLKKAARLAKSKRVELIHVKELLPLTGYIRGGCSPIGMKKKFPTYIDEMIELIDEVSVSGGQRGMQIRLKAQDLVSYTEATVGGITV